MANVKVKITPSLAGSLNASESEWLIFEKEIAEGATIGDLFSDIAFSDAEFRKVIFEPNTGKINDLVIVVLNNKLLLSSDIIKHDLKDEDILILLPVYMGG